MICAPTLCYKESGPITRLPDGLMPDEVSMPTQQFIPTVQKHLDAADRHFDAGELRPGSAELWQASLRALQTVAEAHGWECRTEKDWNAIVNRLAVKLDDPLVLQAGLRAPLIFKDNAVSDFLDDADIKAYRKGVPVFIRRLLVLGGVTISAKEIGPLTPPVQQHLDAADRHFAAGEMLQCSAELWQAGLRALQMVAEARGWECQTEKDFYAVVNRLAAKTDDPYRLRAGLGAPEIFRANAEFDFLDDVEIAYYRKLVPRFIDNLFDAADFKA